jgi:large subunit ribosomal protein L23
MEENTKKEDSKEVAAAKTAQANSARSGKSDDKANIQRIAYRVLVRPHVTEKTAAQEALGKYTFIVSPDAGKVMVMDAVREVYGVRPVSVSIVKIKGKQVRRGRQVGRTSSMRKAIVTLKSGDSLPTGGAK